MRRRRRALHSKLVISSPRLNLHIVLCVRAAVWQRTALERANSINEIFSVMSTAAAADHCFLGEQCGEVVIIHSTKNLSTRRSFEFVCRCKIASSCSTEQCWCAFFVIYATTPSVFTSEICIYICCEPMANKSLFACQGARSGEQTHLA